MGGMTGGEVPSRRDRDVLPTSSSEQDFSHHNGMQIKQDGLHTAGSTRIVSPRRAGTPSPSRNSPAPMHTRPRHPDSGSSTHATLPARRNIDNWEDDEVRPRRLQHNSYFGASGEGEDKSCTVNHLSQVPQTVLSANTTPLPGASPAHTQVRESSAVTLHAAEFSGGDSYDSLRVGGATGQVSKVPAIKDIARDGQLWLQLGQHWRRVHAVATYQGVDGLLQFFADPEVGWLTDLLHMDQYFSLKHLKIRKLLYKTRTEPAIYQVHRAQTSHSVPPTHRQCRAWVAA
jgi:hypothetical protein